MTRYRPASAALAALVFGATLAGCSGRAPSATRPAPPGAADQQLAFAPLDPANRPPAPAQWAGGAGGVPSNQWWSSAAVGPGAKTLWSTPLAIRIDPDGKVAISNEAGSTAADGTVATPFIPALFVEPPAGGADTTVVACGDLHVRLRLSARRGDGSTELTLTRGNVLAELAVHGSEVTLFVPGLKVVESAERWARVDTAEGRWTLATDAAVTWSAAGDRLVVRSDGPGFNLALGPEPASPPAGSAPFTEVARAVAARPVTATRERVAIDERGSVTQTLLVERSGDTATPLALLPHQRDRLGTSRPPTLGGVADPQGYLEVVLGAQLTLTYAPVPVLWSTVTASQAGTATANATATADAGPAGSYFGGKYAFTAATLADLAGSDRTAKLDQLSRVRAQFDRLASGDGAGLAWEPTWGSVVLQPAEFGAGAELNDHQLQYGYWVAAASVLAEADPTWARTNRALVDVLVADYAGSGTVAGVALPTVAAGGLAPRRTWSPYDGHGWASGVVPFDDGNNLESISESAFSSWAAARWFTVTDRPDLAKPFLARFTIENTVAAGLWLPAVPASAPSTRPWSGVVWAAKVDNNTWFDPRPEAALGIRLLPLSPASLARYPDAAAIGAARRRWAWCDRFGGGCGALWPNLLASDAAVAGHAPPSGSGALEPSTTDAVLGWWAKLWSQSTPAPGWSCSAGAIARADRSAMVTVMAANPTRQPTRLRCWDSSGRLRWSGDLAAAERGSYPVR